MDKKWLDFGDFNLIFKVTTLYRLLKLAVCALYLMNQYMEFVQTSTDTSLGWGGTD